MSLWPLKVATVARVMPHATSKSVHGLRNYFKITILLYHVLYPVRNQVRFDVETTSER